MTIFGWDMSHYDAPGIGNALAQGISFITHKAGGDATDAELDDWWDIVQDLPPAKVLLGAYWVLYPGRPAGRADDFLARLDSECPGWRNRPFILQVDCEKWDGNDASVPGKAEIQIFCDRLREKMPKLQPIVYAPKWVYGDTLTGLDYPLWASSYVNGAGDFKSLYPGDSSSRWNAYSGRVPAILQYTSSATIGGQTTCDANAFRGTLDQLSALVAPGWRQDMPLTDSDLAKVRDAVEDALEGTRGARAVSAAVLHTEFPVPADAKETDADGLWWYQTFGVQAREEARNAVAEARKATAEAQQGRADVAQVKAQLDAVSGQLERIMELLRPTGA